MKAYIKSKKIKKICSYCNEEYECSILNASRRVTCGKQECVDEHSIKLKDLKLKIPKMEPNPENFGKCPFLRQCRKVVGSMCDNRDYLTCNFFRTIMRERERGDQK